MDLFGDLASPGPGDDRKPVSVPIPSAYAGVGAALRSSFIPAPVPDEFVRLLGKLK